MGALPKAGSGKQKGSLCKTFSEKKKKLEKISVVFPSCREGHGKDTEQTPGLGLMSASVKLALEPNWPVPEEEVEGAGKVNQKPGQGSGGRGHKYTYGRFVLRYGKNITIL